MKIILKLALLALLIWKLPKFCHDKTDGFSLLKIQSDLAVHPEWETPLPDRESLEPIFNQRFIYLNSGGQSYVFVSEDGHYVLKFFKQFRMRLLPVLGTFPLPQKLAALREIQKEKRHRKLLRDFTSYKLANDALFEEAALVFVHLNKGSSLKLKTRIVDKLHIEHQIDLDNYEFVLQKKAELAYPYLQRLIKEGEIETAKKALDYLCALILKRCEKGIYDDDAKLHRNVGFIDNQPILIDVGRFKRDEKRKELEIQKKDLEKCILPMIDFLETFSSELASHLRSHAL